MRILVVEDDPKVSRSIAQGFTEEGFEVDVAARGDEAANRLRSEIFDFAVLDLNLPGMDGMDVLRTLRSEGRDTPILILTARDAVEQRIEGLEAGADDYMIKPFAFAELLARVRVQLRRGRPGEVLRLKVDDLEFDLVTRAVSRGGVPIEMTDFRSRISFTRRARRGGRRRPRAARRRPGRAGPRARRRARSSRDWW